MYSRIRTHGITVEKKEEEEEEEKKERKKAVAFFPRRKSDFLAEGEGMPVGGGNREDEGGKARVTYARG